MDGKVNEIIVKTFSWFYIVRFSPNKNNLFYVDETLFQIASILCYWYMVVLNIFSQLHSTDIGVSFVIIYTFFVATFIIGYSGLYAFRKKEGFKMIMVRSSDFIKKIFNHSK